MKWKHWLACFALACSQLPSNALAQSSQPVVGIELTELVGALNGRPEPGEVLALNVTLQNSGANPAIMQTGTLRTSDPAITIANASSAYPDIAQGATGRNIDPFVFAIAPNAACGASIRFELTMRGPEGGAGVTLLVVIPARPTVYGETSFVSAQGVAIPDTSTFVEVPITLPAGLGPIADLDLRFDGSACTGDNDATTVGLRHNYSGDIAAQLRAPAGRTVLMIQSPPASTYSENNFCQLTLDDSAASPFYPRAVPIQPVTGRFRPNEPLARFVGDTASGSWTLRLADTFPGNDNGRLFGFSLLHTTQPFCLQCPVLALPAPAVAAQVGEPYQAQLQASGGSAAFVYEVSHGELPPGLTLGTSGLLAGTPTSAGTFPLILRAASAECVTSTPVSLVVAAPADAGTPDADVADADLPDVDAPDAETPAHEPDAEVPDADPPVAEPPELEVPEPEAPAVETPVPDKPEPDAGQDELDDTDEEAQADGGCACRVGTREPPGAPPLLFASALVGILVLRRRRR